MRRRTVLALSATLSISGCVGGHSAIPETESNTTDEISSTTTPANRTYRECSLRMIQYSRFPEPVREEIDTTLADGTYTAEKILLRETMDIEDGYVLKEQVYYAPSIDMDVLISDDEIERVQAVADRPLCRFGLTTTTA
ncbi:hypothetical protein [Haladaptatus caseinilyticus]|uniref:hypothetical protein n=1 Tax=Haladaptatus caseinilyticus TaxID=2993314 RepID=UPI00224AED1B|nr:hypothetical protein [Haladaptatus caseinilyticus]